MGRDDLAWLDDRLLQLIQAVEEQTKAIWEVHSKLEEVVTQLYDVAQDTTLNAVVEGLGKLTRR